MTPSERRETVLDIFQAALRAVDPAKSVRQHMPHVLKVYRELGLTSGIIIVAFGKAAAIMASAAIEGLTGDIPVRGVVITKYGHVKGVKLPETVEVHEAGHPIPDEAGQAAAQRALELLAGADGKTLVLFLISGGGSALLAAPADGITLADKQAVTGLLLKAGATIDELNTVRKHLSRVKGGRLARAAYPAHGISLILSDVIGDRLDVIASGPTSPDPSTFADAITVLEKYSLTDSVTAAAMKVLRDGATGTLPETPKKDESLFGNFENIIIAGNEKATDAARLRASELGFVAVAPTSNVQGEARKIGGRFASAVISTRKRLQVPGMEGMCFIYGGETTVTVKGGGKGGRNTEMALAFALAVEGVEGIAFLSAGTDGTDGPTDAAGAIVDGATITSARAKGLNPEAYLDRNDSYSFFKETGELVITGPTGTNVMDIQIALIERT